MMIRLGLLLSGALAGILVVSPWEPGSAASTGPARIPITSQDRSVARVDVGRRGKSPGDMEIVRQRLFDRTPRLIGRAEIICTFLDSRRSRSCRGTYILPKGRLVVAGELQFRQFFSLAVIGGTGLYDNARGTLTVTRTATRPVRELVLFRLVG